MQARGREPIVVVGAGIGGLATALRLAHSGQRVVVLEKTAEVGGRNREMRVGGCSFDGGPTLLMMLDPLRKIFADVGERIEDHLTLTLCEPGYRVFFSDGERVEGTTDRARMVEQIERLAGPKDAAAYPRMLRELEAMYDEAIPRFVRSNFYRVGDFFGGRSLATVLRHRMLGNYAGGMARYFQDPRVRMLFCFQAMYLGLSPYRAPWVYATLTYMEYGEGIWYPRGGLVEIGRVLARLATARGVEIRLSTPVRKIERGGVELESGERLAASAIVCNADLPYAERELMDEPPRRRRRSCSAFMIYMDYAGHLPDLLHHNVFFGADFRGNLEDIFSRGRLPTDPAFYVCVSSKADPTRAAVGHENVMMLVPCPNLERPWRAADGESLKELVFARLQREAGFDVARVAAIETFSPKDWQSELNLDAGAAFGLSHEFRQSAFFRPSNRSRRMPGVYFVGASTVPGNGLPMVLISAELVEDRMRHDGAI